LGSKPTEGAPKIVAVPKRILITGAGGQLGRELTECQVPGIEIVGLDRVECDITDPAKVRNVLEKYQPLAVINAAAYTAVDEAELDPVSAYRTNADGVRDLANAAASMGTRVVHVSTDYVFDGLASVPYLPNSATNPLNVYGKSKLQGEQAFLGSGVSGAIVRTAWLYARRGKNFLNTILRRIRSGDSLRVVSDQVGSPTSAAELAPILLRVAMEPKWTGVVHWTNSGVTTWHHFALAIQETALEQGLLNKRVEINAICTADYATPARRPRYSVLDSTELTKTYGTPSDWRVALDNILSTMRARPADRS
jgi:dTDP-4-dehydrorhamnose reductase